jgi:hypothetical protein
MAYVINAIVALVNALTAYVISMTTTETETETETTTTATETTTDATTDGDAWSLDPLMAAFTTVGVRDPAAIASEAAADAELMAEFNDEVARSREALAEFDRHQEAAADAASDADEAAEAAMDAAMEEANGYMWRVDDGTILTLVEDPFSKAGLNRIIRRMRRENASNEAINIVMRRRWRFKRA